MQSTNNEAIAVLENEIRGHEMHIASARADIGRFESRMLEYTNRRDEKIEIIRGVDEGIAELNEAIHVLKGDE